MKIAGLPKLKLTHGQARLALALVVLVAAAAAGSTVYYLERRAVVAEAFNRLSLFHGLRKATLEDYMRSKASDVRAMSRNARVVEAFERFSRAWPELGPEPARRLRQLYAEGNPFEAGRKAALSNAGDGSRYSRAHAAFHGWAQRFLEHFGYHDMFLIDREGNILYTVRKEQDFATSLADGPHGDGPLGYAFQQAVRQGGDKVALSDYELYAPSGDMPAAFAASAIGDGDGGVAGVFAVQLTAEPVNEILAYTAGMGETAQTYIVGNDLLMRSQARFTDKPTLLKTRVDTESVRNALNGFSGSQVMPDYRGERVLSVYAPLDFGGAPWVLLAEMNETEVLDRVRLWPALLAALAAGLIAGAAGNLAWRFYAPPGPVTEPLP